MPFDSFVRLLNLDSTLTGFNHERDIEQLNKIYNEYAKQCIINPNFGKKKK